MSTEFKPTCNLNPEQIRVLQDKGTETPGSSCLLTEDRNGQYCCAGCKTPLFHSCDKYDSGTGWPSFRNAIDGALKFTADYNLGYKRTEYHCHKCGGHQGHVFEDGPQPTGLRYCNNGIALNFVLDNKSTNR